MWTKSKRTAVFSRETSPRGTFWMFWIDHFGAPFTNLCTTGDYFGTLSGHLGTPLDNFRKLVDLLHHWETLHDYMGSLLDHLGILLG